MSNTRRNLLLTAIVLYSVAVCIVDIITPAGIEIWVLNVPLIVVPVFSRNTRMVVIMCLACSAMTVLGTIWSPSGSNPLWWDAVNRGMGLLTMWLIAAMAIHIITKAIHLDAAMRGLQNEIAQHGQTSRALEQSEERLRLAVEGAGMGTFDVDLKTGKVVWSPNFLRMLGYDQADGSKVTVEMWHRCVHPNDRERIQETREQALQNRSLYSAEYRVQRVDNGEVVWLVVFGRFRYDAKGAAVRLLGVSFDITRRKELEREVLGIAAREQRHIGQELHDGVGQELTGLGLMSQSMAQRLPETSSEKRIAVRLVAGLNQLHQQIRALARGLIPVEMETKGLWAALDDLAASTTEQSGVPVRFDCPEWVELPDHATSLELYRIAQEAISNALRHGRPQMIRLTIFSQPDGLRLRIKDDGIGMPDQANETEGLGIGIMKYRAELIGGLLRISAAEGGGTVVTVTLPMRRTNDHEGTSSASPNENPDCG